MLLDNVFPNTAELGVVAELLIHQKWSKVKKELCLVSALKSFCCSILLWRDFDISLDDVGDVMYSYQDYNEVVANGKFSGTALCTTYRWGLRCTA